MAGLLGGFTDIMNLFLLVEAGGHLPSLTRFWLRQLIDGSISLLVHGSKERPTTVVRLACSESPAWWFYWFASTHFSALVPQSLVPDRMEVASADVGMEAGQVLPYRGESMAKVWSVAWPGRVTCQSTSIYCAPAVYSAHCKGVLMTTAVTTNTHHRRTGASCDTRGQVVLFGTRQPVLTWT